MYNGQQPWNPGQPSHQGFSGPPTGPPTHPSQKPGQQPYGGPPQAQMPGFRPSESHPGTFQDVNQYPQPPSGQQRPNPGYQNFPGQPSAGQTGPGLYQPSGSMQESSFAPRGSAGQPNEVTSSMSQMGISQQYPPSGPPPTGGIATGPTMMQGGSGMGPQAPRRLYPQNPVPNQPGPSGPPGGGPMQGHMAGSQGQYGPSQSQIPANQIPGQPGLPPGQTQFNQFPGQQQPRNFPGPGQMPPSQPGQRFGAPPPTTMASFPPSNRPQFAPGAVRPGLPPLQPVNQPYAGAAPQGGMPGVRPGLSSPNTQMRFPQQQPQPQSTGPSLESMPSAVDFYAADEANRGPIPYMTNDRSLPPSITTKYQVVDNGNCNPRFMRSTMYIAPASSDLLNTSKLPFSVIIEPMATIPEKEAMCLKLVDHGSEGPIRSRRGRSYINPFVQFVDGGRQYVDRFDGFTNEVPPEYFCHLDHHGRRADIAERPELAYGSVEFVATAEYCKEKKMPLPPAYVFLVDVSYNSIRSGMLSLWASTVMKLLDDLPKEDGEEESKIQVGFITYHKAIHFYNVKSSLAQPQMMILSDIEDVFMPLLDGFTVHVNEARTVIESLLQQIPEMYANSTETDAVLGPAVKAGLEALKAAGRPGKLFVFHSAFPTYEGPGKLKNREDKKLLGTDKEKTLYAHQTPYYRKVAEECVEAGVSVDLFLFPNCYMDIATIGTLTSTTGGRLYRYNYFRAVADGDRFVEDFSYRVKEPMGFDAVMRVRCSPGIRAVDFFGNFFMNNSTDVQLAAIDTHTSIAVDIKHDDKLDENDGAYIQAAILYTSMSGQRRIRVHNLALPCSNQLGDLYRSSDIHSLLTFFAKKAIHLMLSHGYKTLHERLTEQCAEILGCYRKHCAAPSTVRQFILPDCLRLLPLYTNSLLKHEGLRGAGETGVDAKAWLRQLIQSCNMSSCLALFYPRLLALHEVKPGQVEFPSRIRCSFNFFQSSGVYLLENGINVFIWVGQDAKAEFLQQVFGVSSFHHLDAEKVVRLPSLGNPLSHQIREIVDKITKERETAMKMTVIKQKDKLEGWFRGFLVEDKGIDGSPSYIDYTLHLHREIKEMLS